MTFLDKYASGMAPHIFSFSLDSLHSLAYFWACKYDLWRRHTNYQIDSFVFQGLQYNRENVVSTMISRAIRRHVSKYLPKTENDSFSSKYLRISSITKMAAHRGVNFFESHARSVHSLGTNQERNWTKISLH